MRRGLKIFLVLSLLFLAFTVQASAQTYDFTTCGAEGRYGPSQSQCDSAYGQEGPNVNVVGEGIQEWTVPESGEYRIKVSGGQGSSYSNGVGGEGAIIKGNVELEKDSNLRILVGQRGVPSGGCCDANDAGGGGGGSFVTKGVNGGDEMFDGFEAKPLLVAGGGGGSDDSKDGVSGQMSTEGADARGTNAGLGGINGGGGGGGRDGLAGDAISPGGNGESCSYGAGGGGFLTDGGLNCGGRDEQTQGISFVNGGVGGPDTESQIRDYTTNTVAEGAFGGGAGSGHRAGGGGGYSGGGGDGNADGAGGGGSFISADAENPATSDGNWDTTGNEPHDVYEGEVENLNEWNTGHGKVVIGKIGGNTDFCNFRGPINQCVMNQTNELNSQQYNVSSIFEAQSNAVFEAFNGKSTLNLTNKTKISGIWRGNIRIEAERPRIQSGAKFRPEGERIVIGN